MSTNIVQIENLVKRYGNLVALDHLNLSISEGEVFGLLGPNSSGKTTAINCMLSLLKYDKGSIHIFGEEMRPDNYKVKQQIGIVLQNVAVFDELTVYENIDYFCGLYVPDKRKRKDISGRCACGRRAREGPGEQPRPAGRLRRGGPHPSAGFPGSGLWQADRQSPELVRAARAGHPKCPALSPKVVRQRRQAPKKRQAPNERPETGAPGAAPLRIRYGFQGAHGSRA